MTIPDEISGREFKQVSESVAGTDLPPFFIKYVTGEQQLPAPDSGVFAADIDNRTTVVPDADQPDGTENPTSEPTDEAFSRSQSTAVGR